jgi:serine/threonine protein kinase
MNNGSLDKHLKNLTILQKYEILINIASGMDYLHSNSPPIVHRDLKPQNILLNDKFEGKISDFGISKYFNSSLQSTQTQKGTPTYQR